MKYPKLTGKCKTCQGGCGRLEEYSFTGTNECEYTTDWQEKCKKILEGEQTKI